MLWQSFGLPIPTPGEPTSGLEPLTCSLGVIIYALQGVAEACKSRISKLLSLLRFAACCTVLRSRWCQSGVKSTRISRRSLYVKPVVIYMLPTHRRTTLWIGLPGCNPIVGDTS